MLPTLATIGAGLLWFATTMGHLIIMGVGLSLGFALGKTITKSLEQKKWNRMGWMFKRKLDKDIAKDQAIAGSVIASTATQ